MGNKWRNIFFHILKINYSNLFTRTRLNPLKLDIYLTSLSQISHV